MRFYYIKQLSTCVDSNYPLLIALACYTCDGDGEVSDRPHGYLFLLLLLRARYQSTGCKLSWTVEHHVQHGRLGRETGFPQNDWPVPREKTQQTEYIDRLFWFSIFRFIGLDDAEVFRDIFPDSLFQITEKVRTSARYLLRDSMCVYASLSTVAQKEWLDAPLENTTAFGSARARRPRDNRQVGHWHFFLFLFWIFLSPSHFR